MVLVLLDAIMSTPTGECKEMRRLRRMYILHPYFPRGSYVEMLLLFSTRIIIISRCPGGCWGVGRGSPFLCSFAIPSQRAAVPGGQRTPLFPGLAACSQAVITWGCWHSRLGGPYSVNRGPRTAVLDFEKNLFRPCSGKRRGEFC